MQSREIGEKAAASPPLFLPSVYFSRLSLSLSPTLPYNVNATKTRPESVPGCLLAQGMLWEERGTREGCEEEEGGGW